MAEIETHFDADAVSSTSDYGLMQINKCNHDWLLKEGFDVTTYDGNIGAGIYMIGSYIETYGDIGLALMAYNCGPSGAQKLWSQGVYSTDYTRKVMDAYNRWSEVLEVSGLEYIVPLSETAGGEAPWQKRSPASRRS